MSDSPFKPPESMDVPVPESDREPVRRVARYQRWVILALLAQILANIIFFAIIEAAVPIPIHIAALAAVIGVFIFAMVAIFLLAKELGNIAFGILCMPLMFVPCLSLITLAIVNHFATTFLRKHGVQVGFLGVNPNSIS